MNIMMNTTIDECNTQYGDENPRQQHQHKTTKNGGKNKRKERGKR